MTIEDILNEYGTNYRFSKETGMAYLNMKNWRRLGYIPMRTQERIQELSHNKLVAGEPHEFTY